MSNDVNNSNTIMKLNFGISLFSKLYINLVLHI